MDWLEGVRIIRDTIMNSIFENWWIFAIIIGGLILSGIIAWIRRKF